MKLENPVNGFVRIETEKYVILVDPWLTHGIFDGSWANYPTVREPERLLVGATHCFISHIHEDHFDIETLKRLPRSVLMLIPDAYPNHVMRARLEALGFPVEVLKLSEPTEMALGLTFEAIPRMNSYGQETELYDDDGFTSMVIDCGVMIDCDGVKLVLLADNVPYAATSVGEGTLSRMMDCDLLAFSYNGYASDYPLCYDNLDWNEKYDIAVWREEQREKATLAFVDLIQPKALMPYSSEFSLQGPRAIDFLEWCQRGRAFTDKRLVGDHYEKSTEQETFSLYEYDFLLIDDSSASVAVFSDLDRHDFAANQRALYRLRPNTYGMYWGALAEGFDHFWKESVPAAARNMASRAREKGIVSDWNFHLVVAQGFAETLFSVKDADGYGKDAPTLTCYVDDPYYLAALLKGRTHWNTAMGSFNLRWHREPNEYDRGIYDALNFFHLPKEAIKCS